jgi:glycine oxidase
LICRSPIEERWLAGPSAEHGSDAVIIGGGVIGLAIAWRAALGGLSVTVIDPSPGKGASWAAAGMLAPVTEVEHGEHALLSLNLASAERYPSFVAELEEASGQAVGYRPCGTLAVAFDGDDKAVLDELQLFQQRLGLKSEQLSSRDCRSLEPLLAPVVRGGLLVHGDHQVDNRRLSFALLVAAARAGVEVIAGRAAVICDGEVVAGVELESGERIPAPCVVVAAGCWSSGIGGIPADSVPPVRPVKGQILRLRNATASPFLSRNLRGLVAGDQVYLVSRADGELVIGATVEEQGFDVTVTAGAVRQLLHDAWRIVPGVAELELVESYAGLRPGTPDNAPILGEAPGVDGLIMACGHYRNGVLLTPATADAIAGLLLTGEAPESINPFTPERFS